MTITAAADGSSLGNPGPAGWAWYVDEDTWDAGGWPQGTNNLGELTAILRLMQATAHTGEDLHILADSQYAINVVSKWRLGWKKRGWTKADKKPIKNLELIQEIDRAMEGRRVTFEWVKGHAGHPMNERADDLARACAQAYREGGTPEPGPGFRGGAASGATQETARGNQATSAAATAADGPNAADGDAPAPSASPTDSAPSGLLSAGEVVARERAFILAWTDGDEGALAGMTDARTTRIWPGGSATTTLAGPAPASPSVGRIDVQDLGGAFLARYRVRWEGGASLESSVWAPADDAGGDCLVMVHHQSTLIG